MQLTETTPDNKIRLSPQILSKAEEIARTWGLKNSRAAVEAVFTKYADEYLYGRIPNIEVPENGSPLPVPPPMRCECRSAGTGEAVAIWYEGDDSGI